MSIFLLYGFFFVLFLFLLSLYSFSFQIIPYIVSPIPHSIASFFSHPNTRACAAYSVRPFNWRISVHDGIYIGMCSHQNRCLYPPQGSRSLLHIIHSLFWRLPSVGQTVASVTSLYNSPWGDLIDSKIRAVKSGWLLVEKRSTSFDRFQRHLMQYLEFFQSFL